ncbi:DUF6708 domain-containing protein [Pseudogulbenkiania ferrooxidans]|uniref:DUF6708 domain-containing protein n=1 Tax=Pseudogulbenkiania ferrooxidans 2002 TaxID=279714 RepID=B9Z7G2_9NEIS|nr:DUF6708 domain-containing protein [Pseudogulbenkiania ferrooxidans]EEG07477.1 conserved hypothetical protein [Pseudogulbenkiania ferrooxidans 2002]
MYYLEWTVALNRMRHKPGSWQDKFQKNVAYKLAANKKKSLASRVSSGGDVKDVDIHESRAEKVDDNYAIYCKTGNYLDVCTYNDDKRGLLTLVFGALLYGMVPFSITTAVISYNIVVSPEEGGLEPISLLAGLVSWVMIFAVAYAFYRYLARIWRLEAFTMRRLVVRFNRETRQMYFLRPTFLGGVTAYNWDEIDAALPKDMLNHEGVGGMLVIGAITRDGVNPHSQITADGAFVGNACRDYQHLLSFWEYIRRFMEDGPDAVPEPRRRRSKWPNPLASMWTVSRLSLPGGFDLGRSFLWLRLVLTPVFVVWGLGHYASLLLCYEPRFPKAIRAASHESEARSLLALLGYNLLPLLYTVAGLWLYYAWQHGLDWRLPLQLVGWL